MKTRRIQGTDIQGALREVRRTLGPDAIIMSTRETAEGIEVIAAAPPPAPRVSVAAAAVEAPKRRLRAPVAGGMANLVASIARAGSDAGARHPIQRLAADLDALGVAPELRDSVLASLENVAPAEVDAAGRAALAAHIPVEGPALLRDGGRVAVLGDTGVGKTTTVAKLAAHYARVHGPDTVALINLDSYRIGASEQLRRYGRLIGIPVCTVHEPDKLPLALERLRDRRLVLVDTAGSSHRDMLFAEQIGRLNAAGQPVSCYLALSFNTQLAALARTVRSFQHLGLRGCILTKEDEAVGIGAGLSIAARHRLPIGFITTGPKVPADIRIPKARPLVDQAFAALEAARAQEQGATNAAALAEVRR